MQAADVMTTEVATIAEDETVSDAATLMLKRRVSALPVVNNAGELVGIVSEGDLIRRARSATGRSWWLSLVADPTAEFVRDQGTRVKDVMTRSVISVSRGTSLSEIARVLESKNIKRVPVIEGGQLVGLVSRADILRAFAATGGGKQHPAAEDHEIRERIVQLLKQQTEVPLGSLKIIVAKGQVHLWGTVESEDDADAVRVAAESVVGPDKVHNFLSV
jgi:CBS-domain-containing membrane protein